MALTNQEGINCLSRKQVKRMWDINLYPLFQYIGCSTLEKQLAQQGFRGVTTKVLSYSKHTLLCLCEHKKIRQQMDWGKCYYFSFQCIVSRCPNCPKEEWEWGIRGIKRGGYIRINVCKPACVWVLVNTNACGHTHAGLQICWQAIRKRAGSNIMWKRYGIKSRTVLLIFISKMCNKCTIMIRC